MAKTIKMDLTDEQLSHDSKEGQAALAKEVINKNPRKLSEIIKDKQTALKKNEDLLRQLQTNQYDIPFGTVKVYKQLCKFLEKDADWGHTTATGLVMLYSNLREGAKETQVKDWNGIVKLRGTSITILWSMITSMKGKGFYEARNFIELMASMGEDLSKVVGQVHTDNQALRDNHTKLSELDTEVNHPDIILDVAIDKYNEPLEELQELMDTVDPVVEAI